MYVLNSTVTRNTARGDGGGIHNWATGNLTIANTTVSENVAASQGGGIINEGTLTFRNSIITGNSAPQGTDCFGTLSSEGYNLVQDTADCIITGDLTGNITGVDPLLGPLADKGSNRELPRA